MYQQATTISISLPDWVNAFAQSYTPSEMLETRMALVIEAARKNVELETGGPFAAAVFEKDSGILISLGVNLVTTQGLSLLHAEMVALSLAQHKIGSFDLSQAKTAYQLVSSTEPCAMCLGALPWSGIQHLVTGARDSDASAIGFDEGAKPSDWVGSLISRGISVTCDIEREKADSVFEFYTRKNGVIYSPDIKS